MFTTFVSEFSIKNYTVIPWNLNDM